LKTGPEQIIVAPGSKPLLYAAMATLAGDVVLPRPSWVSYAAQAAVLGRRVIGVPINQTGGIPDPARLEQALDDAIADGARPTMLIVTVPDNPTGTVPTPDQLAEVCAIADRYGLMVLSDEIYASTVHCGQVPSAATFLPDRTIVTTGLSKSMALGGWRIGFARTPDTRQSQRITAIASEIWTATAAPMQAVAAYVLNDPADVTAHIRASARLHGRVASAVHRELLNAGATCRPPQAAYYLYPDFAARTSMTGPDLAGYLLEKHDIATLPGTAFGDPATTPVLRIATGLIYGETDERRYAALAADAPEELPWIASAIARLVHALSDIHPRPARWSPTTTDAGDHLSDRRPVRQERAGGHEGPALSSGVGSVV
jgi:aspartate aminotransferase